MVTAIWPSFSCKGTLVPAEIMSVKFWLIICVLRSSFVIISGAKTPVETSANPSLKNCQFNFSDLSRIVVGLHDALDFFQDHVGDLVLDAATGTRILEAQLNLVLEDPSINKPPPLRRALNILYAKSQVISEQIIQATVANGELTEVVKNNTLPWVKSSHLWQTPAIGNWNHIVKENSRDTFSATSEEALNETVSDACIGDLFRNCQLSMSCAQGFLAHAHTHYSLTHQIIFLLVAEKEACLTKNSNFRTKFAAVNFQAQSWNQFKSQLCQKVWIEANSIADQDFPADFQDLLAEQVAICGLAGFKDFLRPDWLQTILSWQNKNAGADSPSNRCFRILEAKEKGSRRKRSDVLIGTGVGDDNCSVHFTAVAMSALGMYLRLFLEFCQIISN